MSEVKIGVHQKHLLDNSQTIGAPKTLIRQFTN
jgi:hypothetical protein